MAASSSAYWVKFFKGAGFPLDVATKHAVVFSNNRIKPDMLPDLDKPSLKDMGITLMGDMIAILRYAKKVVEETTCERFLVDTEDDRPLAVKSTVAPRTIVKKIVPKVSVAKSVSVKPKIVQDTIIKPLKTPAISAVKNVVVKKKIAPTTRVVSQVVKEGPKVPVKRKIPPVQELSDSESDDWKVKNDQQQKKLKLTAEDDKSFTLIMPKSRTIRTQEVPKKIMTEQKRTVFDRLGDSSVTSTTNLPEASPTFNITGLGSDVLKRNSSVFNRLGDKDPKKTVERGFTRILKNGQTSKIEITPPTPQGILKNKSSSIGSTTIISLKPPKATGTMHADHEKSLKNPSNSVRQLVRTTKKIRINDGPLNNTKLVKSAPSPASKLVSERLGSVPAKARLGYVGSATTTKQVTFDRLATVAHIKKPGVFSRLGI